MFGGYKIMLYICVVSLELLMYQKTLAFRLDR